jgi:hypothetical protein
VEGAFEVSGRLERVARIFASIERPYLVKIDASGSPEAVEVAIADQVRERLNLP